MTFRLPSIGPIQPQLEPEPVHPQRAAGQLAASILGLPIVPHRERSGLLLSTAVIGAFIAAERSGWRGALRFVIGMAERIPSSAPPAAAPIRGARRRPSRAGL